MNTEARMMTASAMSKRHEEALEHYGVLGMKWGIRRYQPYGQGGYNPKDTGKYVGKRKLQRELNKTDQQRAQFQDSVTIARKKQEKYQAKGNMVNAEKWKKTGDDYEARLEEAKARTKELIRQADEQGFDVHSKRVQRDVRGGMRFVAALAGGLTGAAVANVIDIGVNNKFGVEEGSKYKLTKRKEDQRVNQMADALVNGGKDAYNKVRNSFDSDEEKDRAERQAEVKNSHPLTKEQREGEKKAIQIEGNKNKIPGSYTPEAAKEKANKARKDGMFDITFLEIVQSDPRYDNRNWLANEYEKYLNKGIDEYWKKYNTYASQR